MCIGARPAEQVTLKETSRPRSIMQKLAAVLVLQDLYPQRTGAKRVPEKTACREGLVVVISSCGFSGLRRALVGNVADSVVRDAHCPVLVVRPVESADSRHSLRWFKFNLPGLPVPRKP
jgi:hypothetical protein